MSNLKKKQKRIKQLKTQISLLERKLVRTPSNPKAFSAYLQEIKDIRALKKELKKLKEDESK